MWTWEAFNLEKACRSLDPLLFGWGLTPRKHTNWGILLKILKEMEICCLQLGLWGLEARKLYNKERNTKTTFMLLPWNKAKQPKKRNPKIGVCITVCLPSRKHFRQCIKVFLIRIINLGIYLVYRWLLPMEQLFF